MQTCGCACAVRMALSQGAPRFSRARAALFNGQGKLDAGLLQLGDECGGTAATEGAGEVRRGCCTAGEGCGADEGSLLDAVAKGQQRGGCERCGAAAKGRDGRGRLWALLQCGEWEDGG